jgi:aminoglycoside 6'-N-acetyltransferase
MMLKLRTATLADLEVLRHGDTQAHVIASDPDSDWEWQTELARNPPWREQLIAELDGRPIGFVQIIDPTQEYSHYWGDVPENLRALDIWLGEADALGKGYGTHIMQLALARCFADSNVTAVLIDPLASNMRAHTFYERIGFRFVERRCFGEDECLVFQIRREEIIT